MRVISSRYKERTVSDVTKVLLRIPNELWEELKAWAAEEDRSLNGQIIHLLRRALKEWRD